MKKLALMIFVLLLGVAFVNNSNAQEKSKKVTAGKVEKSKPVNTVCPVSGEQIENDKVTVAYEGKTYALCCKSCLKKFQKDPAKYIGKLSEDGKSLIKQTKK
jgi:Uncharacterized conserved protein